MSSDEEIEDVPEKAPSKSIALRMQKKMLGMTVKSKERVKGYIDETTSELLDHMYDFAKADTGDEKVAKKVIKDMIKILVKLGLLLSKNQFSGKELALLEEFRKKTKHGALTLVSYHEVAFTFDQEYLSGVMKESRDLLQQVIARHLTDKSKGRVDNVFSFYGDGDRLARFYNDPKHEELRGAMMTCLSKVLEENLL
ncbi:hypothetical protein PTSG_01642 [Salpingoeca rosetta]|uniref:Uncharacterized protein n=1 Tax=Salpingoeca rosetta (strain ATCC 50818 / BSB-021) TaxID=946362 RepID=F2TYI9_SALR5|nr:uncharacterized protein PTSG_01642 [Salpingoeca rosetta]EGD78663.1 hypothetical protein PTSG_01642 [Salpingoeca rosetta]|eukprot:XP_004997621.1 hypothetical protein PTSG_01642 [Salpingoeca rosetta]